AGLANLGREKAKELAKQISKEAEVSEEEGEKLVKEIVESAEKSGKDLENRIRTVVQETLEKMDVPTKKDFALLTAKIEELEQKLEQKES
ncbi:MAG: hypothetical protein GWM98_28830, partial [Nitrospinaceae bacterium]|nr:hypothetical protein [Nitrospinaceae bacterium]NIR56005.1 hypothetical protein [Nitrospinaceae bacterium]NIS86449.1 hypothetical protein [Nitrospinaceae bacterium]NIT85069.1 hypothetical protein [Nitrospinaceae bacterium]NIU45494.1 hypothetical protein [Nitrospinaceae bacterium]